MLIWLSADKGRSGPLAVQEFGGDSGKRAVIDYVLYDGLRGSGNIPKPPLTKLTLILVESCGPTLIFGCMAYKPDGEPYFAVRPLLR
jgi:hypothetical protein